MRNKMTMVGAAGRIAAAVMAAALWTGTPAYAGGGGEAPAASGGGAKGGGVTNGGGQAAPAPAAEHPANAGGGAPVNAGANTAPAVKSSTPTVQGQSTTGGQQVGTNASNAKASPTNQIGSNARDHSRRNRYYSEEVFGDPWSPYDYGWYGETYPYGAYYSEPVYNQPTNTSQTDNSTSNNQATLIIPSGTPNAAILANAVDKSPEMVAANNAVKSAQDSYDRERQRIMLGLKDKPEYQQALARKQDAASKVDAAKVVASTQASTPAPALTDAATVKMDASSEVTKMEEQAVANDPDAAAAKAKLNEAMAKRDELRARMMAPH